MSRDEIINELIENSVESMDIDSLAAFYADSLLESLSELTDEQLEAAYKDRFGSVYHL